MAGVSDYLENLMLEWACNVGTPTRPSAFYVSLHTANPGETGANETTATSYQRQQLTTTPWGSAASGVIKTGAGVTFTTTDVSAVSITHIAIFDASTSGNCLFVGEMAVPRDFSSTKNVVFAAEDIQISLD